MLNLYPYKVRFNLEHKEFVKFMPMEKSYSYI